MSMPKTLHYLLYKTTCARPGTNWIMHIHLTLYCNSHQFKAVFAVRINYWFSSNNCKDPASRHTSFAYIWSNGAHSADIDCSKANCCKCPVQRQHHQNSNKMNNHLTISTENRIQPSHRSGPSNLHQSQTGQRPWNVPTVPFQICLKASLPFIIISNL